LGWWISDNQFISLKKLRKTPIMEIMVLRRQLNISMVGARLASPNRGAPRPYIRVVMFNCRSNIPK